MDVLARGQPEVTPLQIRGLIFAAVNGFVMTFFAMIAVVLYFFGPDIDAFVAGYPVKIPVADDIWRGYIVKRETGREVEIGSFWLHGLRKREPATDPRYVFTLQTQLSEPIPISAYVCDDKFQDAGIHLKDHDVGAVWNRHYCFEMPGTITDTQWLRVSGHAKHVRLLFGRRFPFWKTYTPIPDFEIKPTPCYGPNGASLQSLCNPS